MVDFDLSKLYGIDTKRLKEQVKRNINRFPLDFMFELTVEEKEHGGKMRTFTDTKALFGLSFCLY